MKAIGASTPFIILTCGVLGLVGLTSLRTAPPSATREEKPALVETAQVEPCADGFKLFVDGVVVPYREVSLASRVAGQIMKKSSSARAGEYVKEGELLFEIDRSNYELELRRQREAVKSSSASIEEADVEKANVQELIALAEESLQLQRNEVKRIEALKTKNAATTSRLDTARVAEIQSLNALQQLKNQINAVNARRVRLLQEKERANTLLDRAALDLSRTEVVATSEGIVMQDLAERDDYVQIGTPLVQIEDTSKAEIRFNMRMDQLRWLWTGGQQPANESPAQGSYRLPQLDVTINVKIDGNRFQWPAKLDRYDGAGVNSATRTVPVIAVVESPRDVRAAGKSPGALPLPGPPTLMRNTFVTVEIPIKNDLNLVTVPTLAIRPGETIWVLDSDQKLRVQKVKVAHSAKESSVLLADPNSLSAGDQVITSPLPFVIEGMPLRTSSTSDESNDVVASNNKPEDEAL